jgi:hypothetical protein
LQPSPLYVDHVDASNLKVALIDTVFRLEEGVDTQGGGGCSVETAPARHTESDVTT